jgi:hypothetical protein
MNKINNDPIDFQERKMKKILLLLVLVIFSILSACNLPIQNNSTALVAPDQGSPTEAPTIAPVAISGTWTGILNDTFGGSTYDVTLTIIQPQGGSAISGTLYFARQDDPSVTEQYSITGNFENGTFQFNEPNNRYFWGTVDATGLNGQVGWGNYADAWGNYSLTLQSSSTEFVDNTFQISFTNVKEGDVLTPSIGDDGFPRLPIGINATGIYEDYTVIALEVDGLWVNRQLLDGSNPFNATLLWTPWHGNGDYQITIQALAPSDGSLLTSQTMNVKVDGIPESTPTVKERMIQVYQEQFGLTLTSPAFARYTKPGDYAVEESRWVSAAYIGDKLYEINIFDNGFVGAMSYDLNADNGFCRPLGSFSMLVVFVDYGNTGLDPQAGMDAMAAFQKEANNVWAEYAQSVGLDEQILQIDQLETALVTSPPVPGQALTADEVRTLTGKYPANFDWLVEVDLDANNSMVGQYGGLGVSLLGGCLPGGSQRVNIAFNATDENLLLNSAPGSVFAHELEHGMGWQHWWPNGMANNAGLGNPFWMPALLFGWTDTDGDGTIEILDATTPYGLVP